MYRFKRLTPGCSACLSKVTHQRNAILLTAVRCLQDPAVVSPPLRLSARLGLLPELIKVVQALKFRGVRVKRSIVQLRKVIHDTGTSSEVRDKGD